jgi:hypothetical protein
MHNISCKTPLRLALSLMAIGWSVVAGGTQAPKPSPEIPNATDKAAASLQSKNAKLVPPPGKMRGVTNDMRWAAAIRTSDRQSKTQGKGHKSPNQMGVKQ